MAEPLRHRRTKEADNRYVRPTATAPHLDSTTSGRTQSEHNESAVPREADIGARGRHVALGPQAVVSKCGKRRAPMRRYSITSSASASRFAVNSMPGALAGTEG